MPESIERRRERARVAQRRSRAQRKATLDSLQTRVQVLTKALEDMTEHCLGFSDVVISAVRKDNYDFLRHNAQPFMKKILTIASTVLDEDSDYEDLMARKDVVITQHATETDTQQRETTTSPDEDSSDWAAAEPALAQCDPDATPLPDQQPNLIIVDPIHHRSVSPCLGYGLWPSLTTLHFEEDSPPLDMAKYVDIQAGEISFATALFWNTISLAHAVLLEPSSQLAREFFVYAMRSEPLDMILSRIHRRIAFKPPQMSVYMIEEIRAREEQVTHDLSSVLKDPSTIGGTLYEANMMSRHHAMIVDNMSQHNDDIEAYIDATEVEKRLSSYWGMSCLASLTPPKAGPARARSSGKVAPDFGHTPSAPWYQKFIGQLSLSSRCIGNGIGFPINVVDELALQLRNASIMA